MGRTRRRQTSPMTEQPSSVRSSPPSGRVGVLARLAAVPRAAWRIVAVGAVLSLLLLGGVAAVLVASHDDAFDDAERLTRSLAELVAEHVARAFEAIDLTLRRSSEAYAEIAAEGRDPRQEGHAALRAAMGASPGITGMSWYDREGWRIATTVAPEPVPLNVATQRQFAVHRETPDAGFTRDGRGTNRSHSICACTCGVASPYYSGPSPASSRRCGVRPRWPTAL